MYYLLHEMNHAAMVPFRAAADATKLIWRNPANPLSYTPMARSVAATAELFERTTRRYGKPEFGIETTVVDGVPHRIEERTVWSRPFCKLKHFKRVAEEGRSTSGQKPVLIVAPMSGHYATLLRGTVEAFLPHAEVYVTDWVDARMVPLAQGNFDLDDYIDYVVQMLEFLGEGAHVIAVCQPAVPVLAAVSVMEAEDHPHLPATMTLMGGPIDTRINPTAVNALAEAKPIEWFERRVIMQVPWPNPGFLRRVYPGFLQLGGFMSMNLDRHVTAHHEFFEHLVENDGDSAEKHRDFYDEYLAVMDLTSEFYLQTVETVFIEHALPKGTMTHRGKRVDPSAIRRTALLTIEGENDDISGVGQTEAAHALCTSIPKARREHFVQPDVGHYGIFNGSRFRKHIVPRVLAFQDRCAEPAKDVEIAQAEANGANVVAFPGQSGPTDLPGAKAPAAKRRRAAAPDPGPEPAPELRAKETRDAAGMAEPAGKAAPASGAVAKKPATKRTAAKKAGTSQAKRTAKPAASKAPTEPVAAGPGKIEATSAKAPRITEKPDAGTAKVETGNTTAQGTSGTASKSIASTSTAPKSTAPKSGTATGKDASASGARKTGATARKRTAGARKSTAAESSAPATTGTSKPASSTGTSGGKSGSGGSRSRTRNAAAPTSKPATKAGDATPARDDATTASPAEAASGASLPTPAPANGNAKSNGDTKSNGNAGPSGDAKSVEPVAAPFGLAKLPGTGKGEPVVALPLKPGAIPVRPATAAPKPATVASKPATVASKPVAPSKTGGKPSAKAGGKGRSTPAKNTG